MCRKKANVPFLPDKQNELGCPFGTHQTRSARKGEKELKWGMSVLLSADAGAESRPFFPLFCWILNHFLFPPPFVQRSPFAQKGIPVFSPRQSPADGIEGISPLPLYLSALFCLAVGNLQFLASREAVWPSKNSLTASCLSCDFSTTSFCHPE